MSMTHMDPSTGRQVVGPRDGGPQSQARPVFGTHQPQGGQPTVRNLAPNQQPVTFVNVGYPKGQPLNVRELLITMPEPGQTFQVDPFYATLLVSKFGGQGKIRRVTRSTMTTADVNKYQAPPGYKLVPVEDEAPKKQAPKPKGIVPDRVAREHEDKLAQRAELSEEPAVIDVDEDIEDDEFDFQGAIPDEFVEAMNEVEQDEELNGILGDLDDSE